MKKIFITLFLYATVKVSAQTVNSPIFPITAAIGYPAQLNIYPGPNPATGKYQIFYNTKSGTAGVLTKPIIVVSGYDPGDKKNISLIYKENLNKRETGFLADQLRAEGYDIIIMDYDLAGNYIQRNAFVLVKLIQEINQIKNQNGSSEKNIVWGFSMGGLVTRYALCYMEKNGLPHDSRLMITYDSPHKGAYIPLALADAAKTFRETLASLPASTASAFSDKVRNASNALNDMENNIVNAPATMQMLLLHRNSDAQTLRETLYNELNSMGFPDIKKIAVANGNRSGNSLPFQPGDELFAMADYGDNISLELHLWSLPGRYIQVFSNPDPAYDTYQYWKANTIRYPNSLFSIHLYSKDDRLSYESAQRILKLENVPGGTQPIPKMMKDALVNKGYDSWEIQTPAGDNVSFMPVISALSVNTNNYYYNIANDKDILCKIPFDAFYAPIAVNEEHVRVTTVEANWVHDQIANNNNQWLINNPLSSYNFGANSNSSSSINFIYSNTVIENTGELAINVNKAIDYTLRNAANGLSQGVPSLANFILNTPGKCRSGITLAAQNNGELVVGDPLGSITGELHIQGNDVLRISTGGKVTVNPNSKIIIESGGVADLQSNGLLNIKGNGQFIVKPGGKIILNNNTTLQVQDKGLVLVENGGSFEYHIGANIALIGVNALVNVLDENINITVNNGEVFKITKGIAAQGGILHLEGGILQLRTGASLINENCRIEIGRKMSFHYNQGAVLQLKEDNAVLEIQGDLKLGANAVFTFTYPGTNSGYINFNYPGYVPAPYTQITGGPNASIELKGKSKTDKILQVDESLLQVSIWNGISKFKIEQGQVDFGNLLNSAAISTDADVTFLNCTFVGERDANVYVWGQPKCVIGFCDFNGVGVIGNLFQYGNKLKIYQSNVGGGIRTEGKGFDLYKVNASALIGDMATMNSFANTCTFSNNTGVFMNASPVEFDFNDCKANKNNATGYQNNGPGLLKIKCGEINDNAANGVFLSQGGSLSMNTMFKGGYVEARRSAYATVGLDEADYVDIDNGYNDLRPLDYETHQVSSLDCENYANCGYKVIEGTMINNSGTVTADNNKWQLNNLSPLQTSGYPNGGKDKYTNVTDVNTGNPVHFIASVQSNKAPCDFLAPVCPGCEIKRNFLDNCPQCNVINTPEFVNVKTNDAIKLALSKMDSTAVDGYKHAVTMLYEVLKYPLANSSEGDKYVMRIAEKKILISLAEAIERGQIIASENSMAPEVVKVLDYEDHKIAKAAAENKPVNGLYAALEKVSIYYSSEHRAEALSVLDGMLPSVPVKNLDYVNHMRCVINNELQLLHHQIDQAEFIQHSTECIPARKETITRRSISLSAENAAMQIEQEIIVKVYPNPASNKLTIEYSSQENEAAQFIIYDITGKAVFKKELNSNTQKMEINDLSLSNGIYFYRIISNHTVIQHNKLTVIN